MNLDDLYKPFPAHRVHWRVGATNADKTKGIALAYIDARDVMERLDKVCGSEYWQNRYPFAGCCEIGIQTQDGLITEGQVIHPPVWAWKSNGAGETDFEGTKGQFSDAFKRAGVLWGIGRYLYDLDSPWVEITKRGKSYILADSAKTQLDKIIKDTVRVYIARGEKSEFLKQCRECLSTGDDKGVKELWAEWTDTDQKTILWGSFSSHERTAMKEMMK